jgi:hypothetical protein
MEAQRPNTGSGHRWRPPTETKDGKDMSDDAAVRQQLERTLSGLQKRHEALRHMAADLERKPELTSSEENQLRGLRSQLEGLEYEMSDLQARL